MFLTYSDRYRCVYLPLAKCASTSLQTWIYSLDDQDRVAGLGASGVRSVSISRQDFRQRFEGYFVFTCVRNPFARLVSCYTDKFVRNCFIKGRRTARQGHDVPAFQSTIRSCDAVEAYAAKHFGADLKKGLTFENFLSSIEVDWAENTENLRAESHWVSLYDLGFFDWLAYDYVCRAETLGSDFAALAQRLSAPPFDKAVHAKNRLRQEGVESRAYFGNLTAAELSRSSLHLKVAVANFYTAETVALVKQRFARDLDQFGYESLGMMQEILAPPKAGFWSFLQSRRLRLEDR